MKRGILRTEKLTKTFGELRAVDNVSMEVKEGAFAVLFGPNGAGKTTWINVVTSYLKRDSGAVWFNGEEITDFSVAQTYQLGLARSFQIPRIFRSLTVLENILVANNGNPGENFLRAPIKPMWRESEEENIRSAFKVLKTIDLDERWDELGGELSSGDTKLLDVGKALMSGAKMLLIDEPIAGVNPSLAHIVFKRLLKIREEMKLTILIVEHRLNIALQYVNYAYAMANGKIITEGDPKEVVKNPEVIENYFGEKYQLK
ncbi:MAG: ABC transporter ATP-binding protein [Candidatus Bathyarchaeota archaeon]|nr:ABC transporter ATP-binding protein [Candidatus Bathyarchaeota archaeon]